MEPRGLHTAERRSSIAVRRDQLQHLTRFAASRRSTLYKVSGLSLEDPNPIGGLVYKEYRRPLPASCMAELVELISMQSRLTKKQAAVIDKMTTWPLRVVLSEEGSLAGVVMRLAHERFFQSLVLPSGARTTIPRESQ